VLDVWFPDFIPAVSPFWSRARNEPVREIGVDGQRFADAEFLHHNKAQAVRHAVSLVPMLLEMVERGSLLIWRRPVNARELLRIETLAEGGRPLVADRASQGDRFGDHMVGG
jgi:hypothetical protein